MVIVPLHSPSRKLHGAVGFGNGNYTIETGRTFFRRNIPQFGKRVSDIVLRHLRHSRRRSARDELLARCAVERGHFKTGVIRQRQQTILHCQDASFEAGIFPVRGAGLLDCHGDAQFFRCHQVERNTLPADCGTL